MTTIGNGQSAIGKKRVNWVNQNLPAMGVQHVKQTKVYQKAFSLAMEIFEVAKQFPPEEKFSLTDQIRRSSRSVCACLAEAYRKKKYPAHFLSKISDAGMENSETGVWLDFSASCRYYGIEKQHDLMIKNEE